MWAAGCRSLVTYLCHMLIVPNQTIRVPTFIFFNLKLRISRFYMQNSILTSQIAIYIYRLFALKIK